MNRIDWTGRAPVLLVISLITLIGVSIGAPGIWSTDNLFAMGVLAVEIGIIALGQTFVINTGGIDLSVGAIFALAQVVMGLAMVGGVPWPLAVMLGLGVGVLCGLVNGLATVWLRVPAIIVTLATMFAFSGLALVITSGIDVSGFPEGFAVLGQGTIGSVPLQIVAIYLPLLVLLAVVQWRTRFGRLVHLTGTNTLAARLTGIRIGRVQIATFVIAGGLAALAGAINASRLTTARPDAGATDNLISIAIVVLGGSSIFGGKGSVVGTALATLVIALVNYGLSFNNLNAIYQSGLIGLILIVAVLMQNIMLSIQQRRAAAT
ncbi:ABC transporter permease [Salinisphaera sp. Q1T1-3]|uniref:ABC transporter permease n=1 Tax=Salinisphaera sp. Q1T1-3 TaxID=2321229 RepID=UPI000E76DE5E|nr:ABC transporter permease [Salinisphaera sp. Q1T1-3]RJS91487.1 ABC transporter permease [Salinisphaera sp. Q1T1-3]